MALSQKKYSLDDAFSIKVLARWRPHNAIFARWRSLKYSLDGALSTGADLGIYFGGPNEGPQSKVEGEARIEGAKRPRIEAKPEPRAKPEKNRGEGSGEGARWAPPQKIFEKSNLKPFILVYIWSNYLKWLTKWFNCSLSWKIIRCDGTIKFCWSIKLDRGSGGRRPPEAKTF